jgi:SAM-dependent methyltransferase
MSSCAIRVSENDTARQAAQRMVRRRIPAVPVVDQGDRLLGVVTHWDILRLVARGTDLASASVRELTTESHSLSPNDSLETARKVFAGGDVPFVPVVDHEQLVGVLTQMDIDAQIRLTKALGPRAQELITEMSPSDTMFSGSRGSYVTAGISGLECIQKAMHLVKKRTVQRILDLPCGHGRVLRVLKAAFPEAHLTAGDIDREGVDFCVRVLGATPVYSTENPDELEIEAACDLIWCGSLFTHLDASRWHGFLCLFARSLAPGGLLVFTTLGRHPPFALRVIGMKEPGVRVMLDDYDTVGFGYTIMSAERNWGVAMASPEWVRRQVEKNSDLEFMGCWERAWEPPAPRQDVFACVKVAR